MKFPICVNQEQWSHIIRNDATAPKTCLKLRSDANEAILVNLLILFIQTTLFGDSDTYS